MSTRQSWTSLIGLEYVKRHLSYGAGLLLLMHAARASAQQVPREPFKLKYDLRLDIPITAILGVGWLASEIFKGDIVSEQCHWCSVGNLDRDARTALRWNNTHTADVTSYVTAFALAPVAAYGLDVLAAAEAKHVSGALEDALVITEATVAAAAVNQLVKFAVQRERPFVHVLDPEGKLRTGQPSDNNVSFFSGHTTLAFALATSAGTVAELRGYRMAPVIWATGLPLAFLSGYLRIAADRHYLSDVLTGMAVGTVFGVGLPLLFHGRRSDSGKSEAGLTLSPSLTPGTLGLSGVW